MIECLRKRNAKKIAEKLQFFSKFLHFPYTAWAPVVEIKHQNAFLTQSYCEAFHKLEVEDVPVMFSVVKAEGLFAVSQLLREPSYFEKLNCNWTEFAPFLLDYNYTLNETEKPYYSKFIREFYFGNKSISEETSPTLVQMVSDRGTITTLEDDMRISFKQKKKPFYCHHFTYLGYTSFASYLSGKPNTLGPSHGDDVNYVLENIPLDKTKDALAIQKILTQLWLRFAKDGIPRIFGKNYEPVKINEKKEYTYLEIASPTDISMKKTKTLAKSHTFWDKIPFKENEDCKKHFEDLC